MVVYIAKIILSWEQRLLHSKNIYISIYAYIYICSVLGLCLKGKTIFVLKSAQGIVV